MHCCNNTRIVSRHRVHVEGIQQSLARIFFLPDLLLCLYHVRVARLYGKVSVIC